MKNKRVNLVVNVGVFSAIAFLLQMLGSLMPKVSGFLEMEFSDLPAILIAFGMGPLAGLMVELIKNLLHLFVTTTGGVGELANFVINGIFVLICGSIYKIHKTRKTAIASLIIAIAGMVCASIFVNIFVMLPLYMSQVSFTDRMMLALSTIAPFNLARGTILSIITIFIYKKVVRFLR